ncbi:hypothetical protein J5X84_13385 [Streptosporangiaceae bacterium NEAU-GS5]|nr:hypothetical protein [Streptosporangiaceae bacterium NEAU-GS5]
MRRVSTMIVCAAMAGALTMGTARAAAAATDPAAALAAQFQSAHGVHFTSVTKFGPGVDLAIRAYGVLQFGSSRVAAADLIGTVDNPMPKATADALAPAASVLGYDLATYAQPFEVITVGHTSYTTGDMVASRLPSGKHWLTNPSVGGATGFGGLPADVLDPAQLKKILASAKGHEPGGVFDGVSTTAYHGSATSDLGPASNGKYTYGLSWKLWVGADGLIRRVTSTATVVFTPKKGSAVRVEARTDARLTEWGDKIWVYAPDSWTTAPAPEIQILPAAPGAAKPRA